MIDSHCHLTYPQLASQFDGVLERARAAGVERMITIGTSVADAARAIALCRRHDHIRCAVGIHPHHSNEAAPGDIERLAEMEREPVVLALGEMGLDYHYDFSPRDVQRRIFEQQLELAAKAGRNVVIHSREAIDDTLAVLGELPAVPALFHCFTGTLAEARRILDRGFYIGITGVVTYKKSDELREVARMIPDDRLLVETDAPYLSPEPMRKQKVNEPALVMHTARFVADLRGVSSEQLDQITTANTAAFFKWPIQSF